MTADPHPSDPCSADPHSADHADGTRLTRRNLLRSASGVAISAAVGGTLVSRASAIGSIDEPARATQQATRVDPPPPPQGGYDPAVRYIGIYGFPGSSTLGTLGQLSVQQGVERARALADSYAPFGRPVVPIFEIIASVAAADAGRDGDYSNEFSTDTFLPHLEAAARNGMQVVFDLQSGRSTFPQQAREYEELWKFPNAHLALDPEWRVDAPERPGGGRIGTVDASEVNEVIGYLDALIRDGGLPPKMLVIHQFTPSMVTNKSQIRQTDNVRVVMHMDGFGSLSLKRASYERMVADLPPGSVTGWKNFFDEDRPTPTPAQTVNDDPTPILVTYQ